jgi:hypothetical protein
MNVSSISTIGNAFAPSTPDALADANAIAAEAELAGIASFARADGSLDVAPLELADDFPQLAIENAAAAMETPTNGLIT